MKTLIPEVRVNKNGVAVTKHVRQDPKNSLSSRSVPPPSLTKGKPTKKLSAARFKENAYRFTKTEIYQNPDLQALVDNTPEFRRSKYVLEFKASDVDIYDVGSVCSHGTAVTLMSLGIKSGDEAATFLKANNLDHLVEDNSEWMEVIMDRNLSALPAYNYISSYGAKFKDDHDPLFIAALEANNYAALRDYSYGKIILEVREGNVSIDDIKTIGATRLVRSEDNFYNQALNQLAKIHKGESDYDIETLKQLMIIDETSRDTFSGAVRSANTYGAETILGWKDFTATTEFIRNANGMKTGKFNVEKSKAIGNYYDGLSRALNIRHMDTMDVVNLEESGVPVEFAAEHFTKMPINQIIGLYEGVQNSVSDGWL